MNQACLEVLLKNYLEFEENMVNVKKVVHYLFNEDVLNQSMVDDILSNETEKEKTRYLHTQIFKADQSAFEIYYKALRRTENQVLAEILEPHIAIDRRIPMESAILGAIGQTNSEQPEEDVTDKAKNHYGVEVKKCDGNDKEMQNLFKNDEEVYSMKGRTTGVRVLIINNETFQGKAADTQKPLEKRYGTEVDGTALHGLFKGLGYQSIDIKNNLKGEEIQEVVKNKASQCKTSDNAFICVILSHGNDGSVYGVDGQLVAVQTLVAELNGEKCPKMAGKPKIFFIQACQGEKQDEGVVFEEQLKQFIKLNIDIEEIDGCGKIPTNADILVSLSTTEGFVSVRHPDEGTWYIQELVSVISEFACKNDLSKILTKVHRRIGNRATSTFGYKQCPVKKDSLTRLFYFFPGFE